MLNCATARPGTTHPRTTTARVDADRRTPCMTPPLPSLLPLPPGTDSVPRPASAPPAAAGAGSPRAARSRSRGAESVPGGSGSRLGRGGIMHGVRLSASTRAVVVALGCVVPGRAVAQLSISPAIGVYIPTTELVKAVSGQQFKQEVSITLGGRV